jgi:hypothetical protein
MFTQSTAAAIGFFSSTSVALRAQLGVLQLFCTLGTLTFFLVEWGQVRLRKTKSRRFQECEYSLLNEENLEVDEDA